MSPEDQSNNGNTNSSSFPAVTSVTQALELARDSTERANDPAVKSILATELGEIWGKIQAQPTSYVMSREEFAVFNFYQDRFEGNQVAIEAKKRYWSNQ